MLPSPVEAEGAYWPTIEVELPQGTLDLLILKTIAPALHRLERRGWIKARRGTSDNNRRAKYYELTRAGRARLESDISAWCRLSAAVKQVSEST